MTMPVTVAIRGLIRAEASGAKPVGREGVACMVSVAARRQCSTSCKTASCSEYQQRNTNGGQKTDQQFHLELLEEWRRWLVSDWLADGGNEKNAAPDNGTLVEALR
ncbi:hypothetical protein [Paraburkholderia caribensis]|uniref:hypothetical protein n=1 Tax=Paraburkholderia caribensis TaxID=75105 RepID=UPI001D094E75|nr:hypothetical protein [Paraburkholderia caribensis]